MIFENMEKLLAISLNKKTEEEKVDEKANTKIG